MIHLTFQIGLQSEWIQVSMNLALKGMGLELSYNQTCETL
jgi:hypothetical protein